MISPVVLALSAACLFVYSVAYSDTVVTARDGYWHDPATWSGGAVPDLSSSVVINHQVFLGAGLNASIASASVIGRLVLESNTALQLSGASPDGQALRVTGVLECDEGSLVNGTTAMNAHFEAGSRYVHRQGPLGFIPLATWQLESTLQISGFVDDGYINLAHSNSWRQSFGNVEYDCPAQTVFVVDLNGNLRDIRGDLTIRNTNNKALRLSTTQLTTITIGGDLIIEGRSQVWFTTSSANCTVNIGGDFLYRSQATAASYLATRGNVQMVIGGDWIIDSQSALRMASSATDSTGSRQATVAVAGDFRILRGSLIAPPPGNGKGTILFNGLNLQQVAIGQIATPLAGNLAYAISAQARVNLGESALVSEMGSLELNGMLAVGSTDGGGAIQLGSSGGNIRVPGARTFSAASTIVYNGTGQQTMGDGHPVVPHTVLDNPSGFVQARDIEIRGNLTVVRGSVSQAGHALTVEGHVTLSGAEANLQNLRLSGSINQTINANGATVHRLDVFKTTGAVELVSPFTLTGMLQIGSTGTVFRSQGFLTLLSTGDDASHTAAIGALPAGSSVVGDVTVQRFMSGEGRLYRYLSSPINNATVASLMDDFPVTGKFLDPSTGPGIASANPSLFEYDESTGEMQQGWRGYPRAGRATEAPLQVGRGYAAFVRIHTSTLLDFVGTVNQGEIHLALGYTAYQGTGNGWHLVGNPYPAAIDWDASGITKVGVSYVIAIRDSGSRRFRYWDGDGQYADIPEGRIAPGQAYWVRATSPGASLTFHEEAKTVDAAFYRRPIAPIPSVCISVSYGRISDHAILKLRTHSSDSVDGWDGLKLFNDTLNVSTLAVGGSRLAIDSRPGLPDSVTLQLTDLPQGRYVLTLSAQDSLRHLIYYVKDRYLNRTDKLQANDSMAFLVTADTASSQATRFTLFLVKLSPGPSAHSPAVYRSPIYSSSADSLGAEIGPPASSSTSNLHLHPNPTTGEVIVECTRDEVGDEPMIDLPHVELYNAIGMRVSPLNFRVRVEATFGQSGQMTGRCVQFVLGAEKLSPGTYFMRVSWGRRINWGRFVKT